MTSLLSVARLTAVGRGAVAVVRVRAKQPGGADVLDRHFRSVSGTRVSEAERGRILYGHWGDEDVIVIGTGACEWEVHCHGGAAAVRRILADLGGERPEKAESRLSDRLRWLLLNCRTLRSANYLLAQQRLLPGFLHRLINMTAVDDAASAVGRLLKWDDFAVHLVLPRKIAVVGRPNAGKSSLLNAVLGYERSIVFDQPGTTRDRVEAEAIIDGWPFLFVDTAGVRADVADEVEAIGVDAACHSMADSDVCLLVVDSVIGWTSEDDSILERINDAQPVCVLWNKVDVAGETAQPDCGRATVVSISAVNGTGLTDLLTWLSETTVPAVPDPAEPLPVVPELIDVFRTFVQDRDLPLLQSQLSEWLN